MRDLRLWRELAAPASERSAELATWLDQLAALSLRRRAPFLAAVEPLVRASEPTLRAAAVRVLAGVRGIVGVRAIVAALDDDDERVRRAAVASLRATAEDAPGRWAHAIFHPRADVRAMALASESPTLAAHLTVYLRTDPANAAAAAAAAWPPRSLALLFDMVRRAAVSPEEAARRLAQTDAAALRELLDHAYRRTDEQLATFVADAVRGPALPTARGRDILDEWHAIATSVVDPRPAVVALADAVLAAEPGPLRRRALVALTGLGLDRLGREACMLCAACEPAFVGFAGLPRARRRQGALGLARHRARIPRLPDAAVDDLLALDLVRTPSGRLDLPVAVSIVGLRQHGRLEQLAEAFGLEQLVEAIIDDVEGWRMLCDLPDDPKVGARWLLSLVHAHAPAQWPRRVAVALLAWAPAAASRYQQVIAGLTAAQAGDVVLDLVELERTGAASVSETVLAGIVGDLLTRVGTEQTRAVLEKVLSHEPAPVLAGPTLVRELARQLDAVAFAALFEPLSTGALSGLIRWLDDAVLQLPLALERALARRLEGRPSARIAGWVARLLDASPSRPTARRPITAQVHVLGADEIEAIARCPLADLERALAPALTAPSAGLCAALAIREAPEPPHLGACVALLACHDALPDLGAQLQRFGASDDSLGSSLTSAAVTMWQGNPGLGPVGHAWLCNWESHGFALLEWAHQVGGLREALSQALESPGSSVRLAIWRGMASMIVLLRYRDVQRLRQLLAPGLIELLAEQLDTEVGESGAKMLVAFFLAGLGSAELASVRDRVFELGPDMHDPTRRELERWLRLDGLPGRAAPARRTEADDEAGTLARLRACEDLDLLERTAATGRPATVHEATLRLIELGEPGELRLLALLGRRPLPPAIATLADSLALWESPRALDGVRALARDPNAHPQARHRIALGLEERGETGWLEVALAAVRAPTPEDASDWFTRRDWSRLAAVAADPRRVCLALADAPHPHAYTKAVTWLLEAPGERTIHEALLRFLEQGTTRPTRLRRDAAHKLWVAGERSVLPVIAEQLLDPDEPVHTWLIERGEPGPLSDLVLGACLIGGPGVCREEAAFTLIEAARRPDAPLRGALESLLRDGVDPVARHRVVAELGRDPARDGQLLAIAEIFAWGVRRGRELTGRLFRVHMTSRREDFGHTRLDEARVFVSPLAVLQGDRHGRDIVEGLVLHEFGHHMFHAGAEAAEIWAQAQRRGLFPLLNLVADEHLERNLRALEAAYGDRLKRLAAYGFQHAQNEVAIDQLVGMLLGGSFEALSGQPLAAAYHEDAVTVHRGHLLAELDRLGHPFARFVRALRMGLGNRHRDPLVESALDRFRGGFRHFDMAQLWEVTQQLAQLFGGAAVLARCFGGHEAVEWDERETGVLGAGIDDDDVQREVERILDPRQKRPGDAGGPGRLAINVIPDAHFDPIEQVERVPADLARHRALSLETRAHSERLRAYLSALGLALAPRRARLRGRAFDRTRARAVVLRGDPRMLVARELEAQNDLFIGVAIDCSSSMTVGRSMVKAQHFGVMLADAVRPLAGVDARLFGFNDAVVFDAGDDQRCAVTSLPCGGGNNDAGALLHVARVALASPRRARLLVMISDGLPTECSVMALRGLVDHLSRRKGLLCAQVAVRPLEEVCFPSYVEVNDENLDACVRRFGQIVGTLAGRALGR